MIRPRPSFPVVERPRPEAPGFLEAPITLLSHAELRRQALEAVCFLGQLTHTRGA